MKKEKEKEIPTSYAEGSISVLTILETHSRPIEAVYLSDTSKLETDRKIKRIKHLCSLQSIPFHICDSAFIENNTIGSTHGGIIAKVGDRKYTDVDALFNKRNGFICMIDGIEDPYNFAYSIRSLYAAGVDGIVLTARNWMSAAGVCIRGSAGASELIDCAISDNKDELISCAKKHGYTIVCADENTQTRHTDSVLKKPIFLIIGGEKRGISSVFLQSADEIVKIDYGRTFPMSLTAASAASILAFEVLRQNNTKGNNNV